MSKLTRTLTVAAMLAAMNLAGMTTVAYAQASDPTERQVENPWRHRNVASQEQAAADATLRRVLARERFSIPNQTPAHVPAPAPDRPSRQPGRLLASLGVLVSVLALAGGLAVLTAKRAGRRPRMGQAP
jgi:hypothetical protein